MKVTIYVNFDHVSEPARVVVDVYAPALLLEVVKRLGAPACFRAESREGPWGMLQGKITRIEIEE